MKLSVFFLLLCATLSAQTTLILTGPVNVLPGASVNFTLSTTGTVAAGLEWKFTLPTGYTMSEVVGAAGTASSKVLACSTDGTHCLLYGQTVSVVSPGVIAIVNVTVPSNATPGPVALTPAPPASGTDAATATGSSTLVTVTGLTVNVLDLRDINADGVVNATDVTLMASEVVSGTCANNPNGTGKCDLLQVFAVLLKALNLVP